MPPVLILRVCINTRNIILIIYGHNSRWYPTSPLTLHILYTVTYLLTTKVTPLNLSCFPLELSIFYISDSLLCLSSSPLKQNKIVRFASTYLIRISHILMGKQIAVKIPVSQQTS